MQNFNLVSATGEPALNLATVFVHAAREAIRSTRLDAGYKDEWIDIGLYIQKICKLK